MTNPILYIRYVVNKYLHIVVDRLRPAMWADRPRANGQLPDRPPRLQRWHARTVCFARTNPSRIRSAPISFCSRKLACLPPRDDMVVPRGPAASTIACVIRTAAQGRWIAVG